MPDLEIKLEIVTPDNTVYSEIVDHVVVPTANGKIDILQHHAPLIDRLNPSDIKIEKDGKVEYLAVGSGFVEVYSEKVSIITDQAIKVADDDDAAIEAEEAWSGSTRCTAAPSSRTSSSRTR